MSKATKPAPETAEVKPSAKFSILARGSYILVQLVKVKESKGGIALPDVRQHEQREAVVISVGEGIITINGSRCPHDLRVGDLITLRPNRGTPVTYGGQHYLWLDQADVPVVIRRADGGTFDLDCAAAVLEVQPRAGKVEVGVLQNEAGIEADPN